MISPKQAPVRPRVTLPGGEGESLLEDEVRARLVAGAWGLIELTGGSGAGKSVSLAHLAHVLGAFDRLIVADQPDVAETLRLHAATRLVVCAAPSNDDDTGDYSGAERWRLARWSDDDCIEYLLSAHPQQCPSVMRRLQVDSNRRRLGGLPELWRVVLDQFAADESLTDVEVALRQEAALLLFEDTARSLVKLGCFNSRCHFLPEARKTNWLDELKQIDEESYFLVRHPLMQRLLASEYLAEELRLGRDEEFLALQIPQAILQTAATMIRGDNDVLRRLRKIVTSKNSRRHAMAASLLYAAQPGWRPADGRAPLLEGAYLRGAQWRGIRLKRLNITLADLADSDFSEARFHTVSAHSAELSGCCFHGAQLTRLAARKAIFERADFSHVRAPYAVLCGSLFHEANLEGALLEAADLSDADLSRCNLQRANLEGARLVGANLTKADFTGANLSSADLRALDLRSATFLGAPFVCAIAELCNLESMRLPGANFARAKLKGSLLTGSQMPDACFRGADLRETGLADIEWEKADLSNADLRGCTFHLGSSRSGLVNSPIACEGSRTGFYTDEYHEQEFKAPEDIRKANLRGADLRGAMIDGVDFYLVDLRDAKYNSQQKEHFLSCRAILETRV